jgi:D-alanine transaminase
MNGSDIVYLNGDYLPASEARVSVLDRGFLFGDGIYEVIPVYGGRPFRLEAHLLRLDQSLSGIRLANPLTHRRWAEVLTELIARNGGGDQTLYLQVTRGVAAREHAFPPDAVPTVFAMSQPLALEPDPALQAGVKAITVEDIRWRHCHIKAITLLPNVLMHQQAVDSGAAEAILVRDGEVTEGAASNVFMVTRGHVVTPPKSHLLLPGITRDLVVELCTEAGMPCSESKMTVDTLRRADEVWLTSSSKEVVPVTHIDGLPVGSGQPGPVWAQAASLYRAYKDAFRRGEAH